MSQLVLSKIENGIGTLTVNRREALNSLNPDVLMQFRAALAEMIKQPEVRCIIVEGTGTRAFVAGADITHMQSCDDAGLREFIQLGQDLMVELGAAPVPVIASVSGFALGGGMELAIACDIVVAGKNAKFGAPEVKLGIIPGFGGTQRLILRCGIGQARRIVFSGEMITAEEAHRIGIVDVLADNAAEAALVLANSIAERGPLAVSAAKRVMNATERRIINEGLCAEVGEFIELFGSHDRKEGIGAFLEKRAPEFQKR